MMTYWRLVNNSCLMWITTRVDKFDVACPGVHCCVHHHLGIAKDGHLTVRSLGAIAGLSVPRKERVIGINKHTL
jgi:hypothetical protein